MNNRFSRNDFLSFGLLTSLSWHIVLVLLVVPVAGNPVFSVTRSPTFFLGALLKDSDLMPLSNPGSGVGVYKKIALSGDGMDRSAFFNRSFQQVHKPKVPLKDLEITRRDPEGIPSQASPSGFLDGDITFGFTDFSKYVDNVDFSDLKRMASREDLFPFIEFKIILSKDGGVRSIKKTIGCGDPILDLYVMLKLKNARFIAVPKEEGSAVDVKFRIR